MTTRAPRRPVAVVTGASRGLGRALSIELARHGFDITGLARDEAALAETAAACAAEGAEFTSVAIDLLDTARSLEIFRELPIADLAVANAGIVAFTPVLEQTGSQLSRMLAVNTVSAFDFLRESAATMLAANAPGRLLVISSTLGISGRGVQASYASSKHAIAGIAKSLEEELGPRGIRVTIAYPGPIDTEMLDLPEGHRQYAMAPDDAARTLIQALLATGDTVRLGEIHLAPVGPISDSPPAP